MRRDSSGQWWEAKRAAFGVRLVALVALLCGGLLIRPARPQAAPAPLPQEPGTGIIVPAQNDPATAKPANSQASEPEQTKPAAPAEPARSLDAEPGVLSLAPQLLSGEVEDAKALAADNAHAATFQGLTPGTTTRAELVAKLGEPASEHPSTSDDAHPDHTVLTYQLDPFPQVEITLAGDRIHSILVHLETVGTCTQIKKELKLERFKPVAITDSAGQPLGEAYPERGLTLVYAPDTAHEEKSQVGDVLLECIVPEPFLMRVRQCTDLDLTQCLADLETVHRLDPEQAEAFALESKVRLTCGQLEAAVEAARTGMRLDPDRIEYRVAAVESLRRLGQFDEALQLAQDAAAVKDLTDYDAALAQLQLAKVLVTMPPRHHKQAMNTAVKAIHLAADLKRQADTPAAQQRTGELLIDAELWLARIIAYGPWNTRQDVAPQWLATAEQATRSLTEDHPNSNLTLLRVYATSLECLNVLSGQGDPAKIADAAITLGRDLISQTDDPLAQAAVESLLGTALRHAADVANQQGQPAAALRYANNANALLTTAAKHQPESPETRYELARVQFLIGSAYALNKHDHQTAVGWYEQALSALDSPPPAGLRDERGSVGDQLVSIGVSLWRTGHKQAAMETTEKGTIWLQQAIDSGTLKEQALAVPLTNLAEMHRAFGNTEKARQYARLAAKLEPGPRESGPARRR